MTQLETDSLRLIAELLFGREERIGAPAGHWCFGATSKGYADKSSGPWFRYADTPWRCGLCHMDERLDEYGELYLLSGNGMLAILKAMKDQPQRVQVAFNEALCDLLPCWAFRGWRLPKMHATSPEAVISAAYTALTKRSH